MQSMRDKIRERCYQLTELLQVFGVSHPTLKRWITDPANKIRPLVYFGTDYYRKKEIDAFLHGFLEKLDDDDD